MTETTDVRATDDRAIDDRAIDDRATDARAREALLLDAFVLLADGVANGSDVDRSHTLTGTCLRLLPVDAAALVLFDEARLRLAAHSTRGTAAPELLAVQTEEGPAVDCVGSEQAIAVPDLLATRDRWPRFCRAAETAGYRSVQALPLVRQGRAIGALALIQEQPGAWSARDLHVAESLVGVATIGILQRRAIDQSAAVQTSLQTALDSRVVLEQAKGMLAARADLGVDAAFAALRHYARDHNLRIATVAQDVVDGRLPAARVAARPGQHRNRDGTRPAGAPGA